jgi:thiamine monophosphate synthase
MATDLRPLRGLYAVTPEHLAGAALYRAAESVCAGGACLLQYRNKSEMRSAGASMPMRCVPSRPCLRHTSDHQ